MSGPASRRGFLRGLTTLPLIGGSVSLIGQPTAVAASPSRGLLLAYNEWLFMERRLLCKEAWPGTGAEHFVPVNTGASDFHIPPYPASWTELPQPSTRAALVLSAVGCVWREGRPCA
jgi:hypothetical protein